MKNLQSVINTPSTALSKDSMFQTYTLPMHVEEGVETRSLGFTDILGSISAKV